MYIFYFDTFDIFTTFAVEYLIHSLKNKVYETRI